MDNYQIIQTPITNNPRYKKQVYKQKHGYIQHSTGTPGVKAESFIKKWNNSSNRAEAEFVVDETGIYQLLPFNVHTWHCGGSGNSTHVGCEVCEPEETRLLDINWYELSENGHNNTPWAVTRLQQELTVWGYDPQGIDGKFGPGCKKAVEAFQKDQGLKIDGIVGKKTLHKLQNRIGSLMKYNPQNNQSYFEDVYAKAVWLCAYVLKELHSQVDTLNVLSHAEAHTIGIASNHADVGHWWPEHGKTMDDFRADVKQYMDNGVLPLNEADIAWSKALTKGVFDDIDPSVPATCRQVAIVLNRLNLLD